MSGFSFIIICLGFVLLLAEVSCQTESYSWQRIDGVSTLQFSNPLWHSNLTQSSSCGTLAQLLLSSLGWDYFLAVEMERLDPNITSCTIGATSNSTNTTGSTMYSYTFGKSGSWYISSPSPSTLPLPFLSLCSDTLWCRSGGRAVVNGTAASPCRCSCTRNVSEARCVPETSLSDDLLSPTALPDSLKSGAQNITLLVYEKSVFGTLMNIYQQPESASGYALRTPLPNTNRSSVIFENVSIGWQGTLLSADNVNSVAIADILQSPFDATKADGSTITFWLYASRSTQGVVGCFSDLLIDREVSVIPLQEFLSHRKMNKFTALSYPIHSCLYVDGPTQSLELFFSPPGASARREWSVGRLAWNVSSIFGDGNWHHVAVRVATESGRLSARLFLDGYTGLRDKDWRMCFPRDMKNLRPLEPEEALPTKNALETIYFAGGLMHIGFVENGTLGLYNFNVHGVLSHKQIAEVGGAGLESRVPHKKAEGIALGTILLVIAFVGVGGVVWYLKVEIMQSDEKKKAGSAASNAASGGSALAKVDIIAVVCIGVVQGVLLFFSAGNWPNAFAEPMRYLFFVFSIDPNIIIPGLHPLITPLIQLVFAVAVGAVFVTIGRKDGETFEKQVVIAMQKDVERRAEEQQMGMSISGAAQVESDLPRPEGYPLSEPGYWIEDTALTEANHGKTLKQRLTPHSTSVLNGVMDVMEAKGLEDSPSILLPLRTTENTKSFLTVVSVHLNPQNTEEDPRSDVAHVEAIPGVANTFTREDIDAACRQCRLHLDVDTHHCPLHGGLIPFVDSVHGDVPLTAQGRPPYECAFQTLQSFRRSRRSACDERLYVCPVDSCGYTVCYACYGEVNAFHNILVIIRKKFYMLKRAGLEQLIGLAAIVIAEAIYLPAVRTAMMLISCDRFYICEFPRCYDKISSIFGIAVVGSALVLVVLGLGLLAFEWAMIIQRKLSVVNSGLWNEHLISPMCLFRAKLGGSNTEEGVSYQPTNILSKVFCGMNSDAWREILRRDRSTLKGLYEQYEFHHIWIHPMLLLFKLSLVVAVVLSIPDSVEQLGAMGAVEVTQLILISATNPMSDPWINLFTRASCIHQVLQLAYMSFHRVIVYEHASSIGMSPAMIATTVLFFITAVVVVVFAVVVPYRQEQIERARRQEERHIRMMKEREIATAERQAKDLKESVSKSLVGGKYSIPNLRNGLLLHEGELKIERALEAPLADLLTLLCGEEFRDASRAHVINALAIKGCLPKHLMTPLGTVIEGNPLITQIDVSYNKTLPINQLCAVVVKCPHIRALKLRGIRRAPTIGATTALAMDFLLSTTETLEELDFSENCLWRPAKYHGQAFKGLLEMLRNNSSVKHLVLESMLSGGGISVKAQLLAYLQRESGRLLSLSIANNSAEGIGPQVVAAIAGNSQCSIQVLDLSATGLRDTTDLQLLITKKKKILKELHVDRNDFSVSYVESILKALSSSCVEVFTLSRSCPVTSEEENSLRSVVSKDAHLTEVVFNDIEEKELLEYVVDTKGETIVVPRDARISCAPFTPTSEYPLKHFELRGRNRVLESSLALMLRRSFSSLCELIIRNNYLGDEFGTHLLQAWKAGALPRLHTLDLSGAGLTQISVSPLLESILPSRTFISIGLAGLNLGVRTIETLSKYIADDTMLRKLELSSCCVDGAALGGNETFAQSFMSVALRANRCLRELLIASVGLSDAAFGSLLGSMTGKSMTVSLQRKTRSFRNTADEIVDVSTNSCIQILDISGNKSDPANIIGLFNCPSLTSLNASNTTSSSNDAFPCEALSRALAQNCRLTELGFRGNNLDDITSLASVLETHKSLRSIDFSNCGSNGIRKLSRGIMSKRAQTKTLRIATTAVVTDDPFVSLREIIRSEKDFDEIDIQADLSAAFTRPEEITLSPCEAERSQIRCLSVSLGNSKMVARNILILCSLIQFSRTLQILRVADSIDVADPSFLYILRRNITLCSFTKYDKGAAASSRAVQVIPEVTQRNANFCSYVAFYKEALESLGGTDSTEEACSKLKNFFAPAPCIVVNLGEEEEEDAAKLKASQTLGSASALGSTVESMGSTAELTLRDDEDSEQVDQNADPVILVVEFLANVFESVQKRNHQKLFSALKAAWRVHNVCNTANTKQLNPLSVGPTSVDKSIEIITDV